MMFREMRRRRQALPEGECVAILERMTSGVLAVEGDGGYPYAVPMCMLGESCISTARGRDTRWTPCGGTRRHRFAWWSVTR